MSELTHDEKQVLDRYINEYMQIQKLRPEIDKEVAVKQIQYLYKLAGFDVQHILFVKSPLAARYASNMIRLGKEAGDEKIKSFAEKVETVADEVWDQALEAVVEMAAYNPKTKTSYNEFSENVRNYMKKHSYKVIDNDCSFCWNGSVTDCGYLSYYQMYKELGKLETIDVFEEMHKYVHSGIYDCIQYEEICIACSYPQEFFVDEQDRLHCPDKAAITFRDGYSVCFWHGLRVPHQVIYFPETLTVQDLNAVDNVEVKRAYMEILGEKRFFELLDVEVIDESTDRSGRPLKLYKTKEMDELAEEYLYFIHIIDHSTERTYVISVEGGSGKARTELARTYGKDSWDEYHPELES